MYSQAKQDQFVLDKIGKNGRYLEIGSAYPITFNNTYLLELNGWTGLSIDFEPSYQEDWLKTRKNPLVIADALTYQYPNVERYDYLQLDIDPTEKTFALLQRLLKEYKTRYSVITFETDAYLDDQYVQPSRQLLQSHGYELAVANVVVEGHGAFEDWYIDKTIKW
jgi:hypothetical protein